MTLNSDCSFELTILGSAGGPLNSHTQCFLLKRAEAQEPGYICIDAGSGLTEIADMFHSYDVERTESVKSLYHNSTEDVSRFLDPEVHYKIGFGSLSSGIMNRISESNCTPWMLATELFSEINEYFITHPHLDHIVGLVLNSPLIYSKKRTYKNVYGIEHTIQAIEQHIFNDIIWPDFVFDNSVRLRTLDYVKAVKVDSIPNMDCIPFKLQHGISMKKDSSILSTAFLFHDLTSDDRLVIFGDTESDMISKTDALLTIWKFLANNVPINKLKALVIECSNTDQVGNDNLYGHMSPRHIVWELKRLVTLYDVTPKEFGLHVILTHVKDHDATEDPKITVLKQIRNSCKQSNLDAYNIHFSMALQGFTFIL